MNGLKYSEVIKFLDSEIRNDELQLDSFREKLNNMNATDPDRNAIRELCTIYSCELIHTRGIKSRFEMKFIEYNNEENADE